MSKNNWLVYEVIEDGTKIYRGGFGHKFEEHVVRNKLEWIIPKNPGFVSWYIEKQPSA